MIYARQRQRTRLGTNTASRKLVQRNASGGFIFLQPLATAARTELDGEMAVWQKRAE